MLAKFFFSFFELLVCSHRLYQYMLVYVTFLEVLSKFFHLTDNVGIILIIVKFIMGDLRE
ncbi:hypothetical protein [Bacillus xiapuensis]|uniref:hypothetical protein n=1 Tax=Bacillus xiapuensis TaxID=2014075 RepID=UPI001E2A7651|nr:hypothetical protein [Bacillus xiapuensis]